jgi:hypothetical protein
MDYTLVIIKIRFENLAVILLFPHFPKIYVLPQAFNMTEQIYYLVLSPISIKQTYR